MKWFLMVMVAVVVWGCGTTVIQLHTTCEQSNEEIFQGLTSVLLSSNFMIKQNDPKNGYLQAETIPEFSIWTGQNEMRVWSFQLIDSIPKSSSGAVGDKRLKKLISSAKAVVTQQNAFGATTGGYTLYYNDKTHKDWNWYWDIRNKIQQQCSEIRFVEKKVN
jgi:hypothetical protein